MASHFKVIKSMEKWKMLKGMRTYQYNLVVILHQKKVLLFQLNTQLSSRWLIKIITQKFKVARNSGQHTILSVL